MADEETNPYPSSDWRYEGWKKAQAAKKAKLDVKAAVSKDFTAGTEGATATSGMPKQGDYKSFDEWRKAVAAWREKKNTASEQATAIEKPK